MEQRHLGWLTGHGAGWRRLALPFALGLLAGCATAHRARPAPRTAPFWLSRPTRPAARSPSASPAPSARAPRPSGDESAAQVAERIQAAGFHFGTDGTPGALWGYMRTSHQLVDPRDARPGDVVFFDTRSRVDDGGLACADRVGVVGQVDADGRITFFEVHAGEVRWGYAQPHAPLRRRDERGEILNSFLRPKRIGDADGTRYFAGEMLCGVARIRRR